MHRLQAYLYEVNITAINNLDTGYVIPWLTVNRMWGDHYLRLYAFGIIKRSRSFILTIKLKMFRYGTQITVFFQYFFIDSFHSLLLNIDSERSLQRTCFNVFSLCSDAVLRNMLPWSIAMSEGWIGVVTLHSWSVTTRIINSTPHRSIFWYCYYHYLFI